jgi:hypothetical protein
MLHLRWPFKWQRRWVFSLCNENFYNLYF